MEGSNGIGARQYFEKADFVMPELFLKDLWIDHMIKNEILLHWLDVEFLVGEKITTHPTIFGNLTLTLI